MVLGSGLLGMARALGLDQWPLDSPAASRCRLGRSPLGLAWPYPYLGGRRLALMALSAPKFMH